MTDKEYLDTQVTIVRIATTTLTVDVEAFLERISKAHAVGPVVDPTLYRDAMKDLQTVEGLSKALKSFKEEVTKVFNQ